MFRITAYIYIRVITKYYLRLQTRWAGTFFARRRKLRPQPVARQVQARPKSVYSCLQYACSSGSDNVPLPSNESPRRRGRSPSPGRRGRSNSPIRHRHNDGDDMLDNDEILTHQ